MPEAPGAAEGKGEKEEDEHGREDQVVGADKKEKSKLAVAPAPEGSGTGLKPPSVYPPSQGTGVQQGLLEEAHP